MLFHNTDTQDHKVYFEILDGKGESIAHLLEIVTPKEPFKVKAGKKIMQVVRISTKESLEKGDHDIIVRAFAVDAKDQVFVERKAKFIYPDTKLLKD